MLANAILLRNLFGGTRDFVSTKPGSFGSFVGWLEIFPLSVVSSAVGAYLSFVSMIVLRAISVSPPAMPLL